MKGVDSMIRLGIVYEIHSNKVIVLTPDSEFLVIRRTKDMYLGQQVKFNIQDVKKTMKPVYKYASVASSIAAVFVLVFLYLRVPFYDNVYGYINVDVNPSIEFVVDKDFEVLQTKALNNDAKEIAKELNAKGKDAYSVINEFVDKCEDYGYIDSKEDNVVIVSASINDKSMKYFKKSEDDKDLDKFLININQKIDSENEEDINSRVIKVTPEDRKAAIKKNLSMGKYYLMEKARESGLDLSVEDLDKEKISDLLAAIDNEDAIITADATMDLKDKDTTESDYSEGEIKDENLQSVVTPTAKTNAEPSPTTQTTIEPTAKPTKIPTTKPTANPIDGQKVAIATPKVEANHTVKPITTVKKVDNVANEGALKIQLQSLEKSLKCQIISSKIHIINTSGDDIDLSKVKARYYFTKEGRADLEPAVYSYNKASLKDKNYFKQESTSEVKISFHKISGELMYMEIGFTSGVLKKNEYVNVMTAFNNEQWDRLDQSDDYSYIKNSDTLEVTKKVTGYISDKLVWGLEP